MRRDWLATLLCFALAIGAQNSLALAGDVNCLNERFETVNFTRCHVKAGADIRIFLNDANDAPLRHFSYVDRALRDKNEKLIFAMNGGMYHKDRSPVGLYVEDGVQKKAANTNDGPGNFHLKPNGVFWVAGDGGAHVSQTDEYLGAVVDNPARHATQSGPMLVINGEIHPRFLPDSTSRKRRNGVGVAKDGSVYFVLADAPVTFFEFAAYFRDALQTPNALFLDGTISRLYATDLERNDPGAAMGPIIGVVTADD